MTEKEFQQAIYDKFKEYQKEIQSVKTDFAVFQLGANFAYTFLSQSPKESVKEEKREELMKFMKWYVNRYVTEPTTEKEIFNCIDKYLQSNQEGE